MSALLVIAFDKEADGFELRTELVKMQQESNIKMQQILVVQQ